MALATLVLRSTSRTLEAYKSLVGLRISPSPNGVSIVSHHLSVHRVSPLFPLEITLQGDHLKSNPRPSVLRHLLYMLSLSII